jgi:hypothetical protein
MIDEGDFTIEVEEGIENGTHCICGRPLSENYWKDTNDNCYSHMSNGV